MKKEIIYHQSLEFKKEGQAALTLYGDAIHIPGDGGLGGATGPAGQHAVLSWS